MAEDEKRILESVQDLGKMLLGQSVTHSVSQEFNTGSSSSLASSDAPALRCQRLPWPMLSAWAMAASGSQGVNGHTGAKGRQLGPDSSTSTVVRLGGTRTTVTYGPDGEKIVTTESYGDTGRGDATPGLLDGILGVARDAIVRRLEVDSGEQSPESVKQPREPEQGEKKGTHVQATPTGQEAKGGNTTSKPEVKGGAGIPKGGHLMISYQWQFQKTAMKIRDKLREKGFKVWMDVDGMSGNIVDAMAEAVDGATAVLMCMSKSYEESDNCRKEIEYATLPHKKKPIIPLLLEKGYRPDKWVGVHAGHKLYFDFTGSGLFAFGKKMDELVKELEKRGFKP